MNMRAQERRFRARHSTVAGLSGIGLMVLGFVLTLAHVTGNVVPTALFLVGFVLLNVGIGTGALLVFNNFRYSRKQSYYDPDEEEDE